MNSPNSFGRLAGFGDVQRKSYNSTLSGDTDGQCGFPILGKSRKTQEQPVFTAYNAVLWEFGRSHMGSPCLCGFAEFLRFSISGDTGAHGKDFGKDFKDKSTGCVAMDWYERNKNKQYKGGYHE